MSPAAKPRHASHYWPLIQAAIAAGDQAGRGDLIKGYMRTINHDEQETDPFVVDFFEMLCAYEYTIYLKNNKNNAASYTRRKIKAKGLFLCCIDLATDPKITRGFDSLSSAGMKGLTAEALVLRYAERFPKHVVEMAKYKIRDLNR